MTVQRRTHGCMEVSFLLLSRSHLLYSHQHSPCMYFQLACTPPPCSSTWLTLDPSRRPTKKQNSEKKPTQKNYNSAKQKRGRGGKWPKLRTPEIPHSQREPRDAHIATEMMKVQKKKERKVRTESELRAAAAAREHRASWAVKLVVGGEVGEGEEAWGGREVGKGGQMSSRAEWKRETPFRSATFKLNLLLV